MLGRHIYNYINNNNIENLKLDKAQKWRNRMRKNHNFSNIWLNQIIAAYLNNLALYQYARYSSYTYQGNVMPQNIIRQRLRALREGRDYTQENLAQALGFNDRQTLSDIERGERKVSAEELILAAEFFGVDPDYFTDPLELAGEARFSWRKNTNDLEELESFEQKAGKWIATYKHLSRLRERTVNSFLMQIGITKKSSYEEASLAGDGLTQALDLMPVPAEKLPEMLEEDLNTLVLFVDPEVGISGAACQLSELNTIIINRRETEGRRSFDLAHEFFHLLTWGEMPPEHFEAFTVGTSRKSKVEKLADSFAAGLLMPSESMFALIQHHNMPSEEALLGPWIRGIASTLHVSGQAVKWRLVSLGILKRAVANRINDLEIQMNTLENSHPPARFSARFVEMMGWGIEKGHISARRASKLLQMTVDDLTELFAEHSLRAPFEL